MNTLYYCLVHKNVSDHRQVKCGAWKVHCDIAAYMPRDDKTILRMIELSRTLHETLVKMHHLKEGKPE